MTTKLTRLAALCAVSLCASGATTAVEPGAQHSAALNATRPVPIVSVVIDDVGNLRDEGLRAVELPGSVTYAILPHTAHGARLARIAHSLDKEIIVHVPMEAISGNRLGAGGLTADMSRAQFKARADAALASVPFARGASNHMGSKLTAMQRPMQWLMDVMRDRRGWLFLDSRTTAGSVAETTARSRGIRTTFRDVFLDNEVSVSAIRLRFQELIAKARSTGSAVAIGHPYPETLRVLADELPRLNTRGVKLVPLSALVKRRANSAAAKAPWQVAQSSASGQAATTR